MNAKHLLTFVVLFSFNFSFGQERNNDISLKYNQSLVNNLNRKALALEYRRQVGKNLFAKFGLEYGRTHQELFLLNNVIDETSSTVITRQHGRFMSEYNLYGGVDRTFLNYFIVGAAFTGGFGSASMGIYDRGSRYDPESGTWDNCTECAYAYHSEELKETQISTRLYYSRTTAENRYFTFGLNLRGGIEVPLGNAFKIGAAYEAGLRRYHFLSQRVVSDIDGPVPNQQVSFNQTDHSISVLLRYRF